MTTKPDLTRVWASGAPGGNIEDPDVTVPGKFSNGWTAEIPPFENFNFLQQLITQGLAHANEFGVMQWDTNTVYPLGGWARSTVDDEVYVSLVTTNQGNEPSASPVEWELLSTAILSTLSASDVSNTPAGSILATDVQAAINELDTEKEPTLTSATTAEMEAGTESTLRSMSPLRVAEAIAALGIPYTAQSLLTNGYIKLVGGLIIQWGSHASIGIDSSITITFPIAFPVICRSATATPERLPAGSQGSNFYVTNYSAATMVIANDSEAASGKWIAIGY